MKVMHHQTKKRMRVLLIVAMALQGMTMSLVCGAAGETAATPQPAAGSPEASVTQHTVKMGNETLRFTAVAGKITLRDDTGQPTATMSYVAYTENGVPQSQRPVTFVWGGGPGATSTGLQVVGFGPKLVLTANAAHTAPAPYKIVDNPYSLLNVTDLVFLEEVDTGYGRLIGHAKIGQFAGVDQDATAFTQAIIRYLNANNRWNSPKYLMGNSYGTTRDAVVANDLQEAGADLTGVVLISTVLNFETLGFDSGNDLPYVLFLPTYAALAQYHHALAANLESMPVEQFLEQVQSFAAGEYAHFLLAGDAASAQERQDVERKLAAYTGLSTDYIEESNYRIRPGNFRKELLLARDQVIGRMDGRFLGMDHDQVSGTAEYDPLEPAIGGPYTAAMNYLLHNFLNYNATDIYRSSCYGVCVWDWHRVNNRRDFGFRQGYADVSVDLREAMIANPQLKLFVSCGYYDLATPFFASTYTYDHLNIGDLKKNITIKYYASGHVSYLRPETHARMYKDLEDFYRKGS
jgi:carboxypeptidase C (cathepsin A)